MIILNVDREVEVEDLAPATTPHIDERKAGIAIAAFLLGAMPVVFYVTLVLVH